MQTGGRVDSIKCSTYFTFDCWKNSISGDLQNIYIYKPGNQSEINLCHFCLQVFIANLNYFD